MHTIKVGANLGNWTRTTIEYFPDATCSRFEPQDDMKRHVGDLLYGGFKIQWINAGAGDTPEDFRSRFPIAAPPAHLCR
jgi:hypothetical protein